MFSFLLTGTIFDLFQLPGKISEFKEFWNIIDNDVTICCHGHGPC